MIPNSVRSRRLAGALGLCAVGAAICAGPVAAAEPGTAPAVAVPASGVGSPFELAFWQSVVSSGNPALYQAYLDQFPHGTFMIIARAKLSEQPAASTAAPAAAAPTAAADAAPAAPALTPPPPPARAIFAPASPFSVPLVPLMPLTTASADVDALPERDTNPVASPKLLAALNRDRSAPAAAPVATSAATAVALAEPVAPAMPAPPPVFAAALPVTGSGMAALAASQVTPRAQPAAPVQRVATAPAPAYVPRPPARVRNYVVAAPAPRIHRAVVSTAATSPAMADFEDTGSPLGLMLAQLSRTQTTPGSDLGMPEIVSLPLRPRLQAVPQVVLPAAFCSVDQRNAFDEGVYRPALAVATHNNEVATGYLRRLRAMYDNAGLAGDTQLQAAIAAEAREFAAQAKATSTMQSSLVQQFEDIMTNPMQDCGGDR